jgi:DNA-binding response OmpR family regulator
LPKILIIDDDVELTKLVSECIEPHGYTVFSANDGNRGIEVFRSVKPDLILLDIMLPDKDGFAVCQEIRTFSQVPIIMLTARGSVDDRVTGLGLGGDDYLPKPFDSRELLLRISGILRRTFDAKTSPVLTFDSLSIDLKLRNASKDNVVVNLTNAEFDLMALLAANKNRPVTRDHMSEAVLGTPWKPDSRSVDIIMSRLRKKIGFDSRGNELIKTIRGIGYMLVGD